jgi:hypothetical protein
MQSHFMQRFWPYQLWRFFVVNTKMYMIARGIIGPERNAHGAPRTENGTRQASSHLPSTSTRHS